jgi:muramoyltetrapeptide carboxypeptidase
MKRKDFIATIAPLTLALTTKANYNKNVQEELNIKIPKYLNKGDTIGITCPAGYLKLDELKPAKLKLEEWGFNVKIGKTIGLRSGTFGGTDEERKNDFQEMLNDTTVKAILCGRGGYGCNRILDDLDFTNFKKKPKWVIGFSDITLLHTHLNTTLQTASLHSKMCNSFLSDWSKAEPLQMDSINSIKEALYGKKMKYSTLPNFQNKNGVAKGLLVGGNLSIIYSAMNTKSQLDASGKILFLEEVSEYLYSIDRMLWNLRRSGMLKNLKGLIIGGMKHKPSETVEEEFGENIFQIVKNVTRGYNYPICFDFPVGHQKVNYAYKCGVMHKLSVGDGSVVLEEV